MGHVLLKQYLQNACSNLVASRWTLLSSDNKVTTLINCICRAFNFSSREPKARVSYCHSAPSVVRPSVCLSVCLSVCPSVRPSVRPSVCLSGVNFSHFSTFSPEPLDGFWWNLVGMKFSWSLTSVVVFRPNPPRGRTRAGQNRSPRVPFFNKLLQTGRLQHFNQKI